jgi:hypothetical protein
MCSAGADNPARDNLASLGYEVSECLYIFIVNVQFFVVAETTGFPA